jgi:hypothetical protein
LEEGSTFVGLMTELMAKNAKGPGGVAKAAGDIVGGQALNEEGAEGFILPVEGLFGFQEETGFRGLRY